MFFPVSLEDKPEVGLDKALNGPSMGVFGTNHPLRLKEMLIILIKLGKKSDLFSSNKKTLSSFFRTAGGDLISTENCKEDVRIGIRKQNKKGKSPLEADIRRL